VSAPGNFDCTGGSITGIGSVLGRPDGEVVRAFKVLFRAAELRRVSFESAEVT